MSNKCNRIVTHGGSFYAEEMLVIVLYIIWRQGEICIVEREPISDEQRDQDTFYPDKLDLETLFESIKDDVAKQYITASLREHGYNNVSEDKYEGYISAFIDMMYTNLIRYYVAPWQYEHRGELTISDIVRFMNKSAVTSEEQDKAFHKTLDLMKEWIHAYLSEIADMARLCR